MAIGFLVRVGIDQTFGGWNCPVCAETLDYVYVPIPEQRAPLPGLERRYSEVILPLVEFCSSRGLDAAGDLGFPSHLCSLPMHLDPDFEHLTYGDAGRRGLRLSTLQPGDFIAFYAGLRSMDPLDRKLLYALIGFYEIDEWLTAGEVPEERWHENAHTRRRNSPETFNVVMRAKPGVSGRLRRCIPIGEWRNRSYRVREDLLSTWGGLSVRDGFLQRSANPPRFTEPDRFLDWWARQRPELVRSNWGRCGLK